MQSFEIFRRKAIFKTIKQEKNSFTNRNLLIINNILKSVLLIVLLKTPL